jgi:Na+-transporting NADH:ubiquinone oxidoreductase subunit A
MSEKSIIHVRKGYDIKLEGAAVLECMDVPKPEYLALKPTDFNYVIPKLLVAQNDEVQAGQALFYDKDRPEIRFPSPASGIVTEIVRGEKRKILEIRILADKGAYRYEEYPKENPADLLSEAVKTRLLESNCWCLIRQRPYSCIAHPSLKPKALFISCFDSAPLAPDLDFIIQSEPNHFEAGLRALHTLCPNVHLGLKPGQSPPLQYDLPGMHIHYFRGPHPSGNVGIQIHHVDPIRKGDVVWYVHPQDVIVIGRLFLEGRYRADRIIALTGSQLSDTRYYRVQGGHTLKAILDGKLSGAHPRIIQGNVLHGLKSSLEDTLSFYTNHITVIPEGDQPEFMGWLLPGFRKLSLSRTFLSWLFKNRRYALDTNMHGEERPFVMTGQYDKVLPMDILPVMLLKSILAEDVERMEQLGIYEVSEEDFALCEFVCTSKIDVQHIISRGLEMMKKEE